MKEDHQVLILGLLARRERLGLTWRGRILIAGLILAFGIWTIKEIHPFLAPTERLPARLLVIEGWSPPTTMKEAAAEFQSGRYQHAVLVRTVLDSLDQYESGHYYGTWMSKLLVQNGVPEDQLTTLFPIVARKDRTYHSALAVKQWIADQHLPISTLNVATDGPHARRSRLLYEQAFGDGIKIGIIALQSPTYDPNHWWRTSEGVRDVLGETIAYLYAKLFFWPCQEESGSVSFGTANQ